MDNEPLDAIYAYVERAALRLQAADLLNHCLEENNPQAVREMVEELVIVGPQSLDAIREILAEVASRRSQLQDDRHVVFSKLEGELRVYGVKLATVHTPLSLTHLTPYGFLVFVRQQGVEDEPDQLDCLQLWQESLDILKALENHLQLLYEIDYYLQDWMWGLIFETTHQRTSKRSASPPNQQLL